MSSVPIRVCHMIPGDQWAGAEVQTLHLLSGLAQCPQLELSVVLFSDGLLAYELRRLGVALTVLDEQRLSRWGVVRGIIEALRDWRVQILHAHGYKANILSGLAGRWAGVRWFVRTEHGYTEPFRGLAYAKMALYKGIDRLFARFATHWVIVVSYDMYAHWVSRLPGGRVALVPNGIDPEKIKPRVSVDILRRELGILPGAPIFGTAGRLAPVKGLDYLLQAVPEILKDHPDSCFLIVGEGPLLSVLERLANNLGIRESVYFLGFRQDVYDLLNLMDVFVLPSLSEGLPMVLLEAMALGKPIVASAVGGIPEVLRDSYSWLIPPRNTNALTQACLAALAAARRGNFNSNLQNRLDEMHIAASAMCQQTLAIYQELVGHHQTPVKQQLHPVDSTWVERRMDLR